MKRFASAMGVAGIGLCLAGCGLSQEAAMAQQAQKIKEAKETSNAVVRECREKHLRGELNHKQMNECANPRIYAAWQEAGDPYLDLLNIQLAAALVCGENIDKGKATEAECRLQIAELQSRLNNERQRREAMRAQAAAQTQAANAQSAAVLMQGLAALQTANRPSYTPTYTPSNTVNCTTTGPYAVRSTSCY
jgi:hypothetical protein